MSKVERERGREGGRCRESYEEEGDVRQELRWEVRVVEEEVQYKLRVVVVCLWGGTRRGGGEGR